MKNKLTSDVTEMFTNHFRVETNALLEEIVNCSIPKNAGVLRVPLNVFKNLLAQLAQRCTELNDPVLNRICFDMTLYELPTPTSPEYNEMMKAVYEAERQYLLMQKLGVGSKVIATVRKKSGVARSPETMEAELEIYHMDTIESGADAGEPFYMGKMANGQRRTFTKKEVVKVLS